MFTIAGIISIMGFILFIIYRFRSDGITSEKLKNSEAINDQNDELLEFLKKQKDFNDLIVLSPANRERMRTLLNDRLKK